MASTGWFYTRGSRRFGPVSATELKQLADHGELATEELVWREGMEQWVPARRVKGLFDKEKEKDKDKDQDAPAVPQEEAPSLLTPIQGEVAAPPAEPAKVVEPPTPAAPPAKELTRPARATFETSASAFERAREGTSRHLFDAVLEAARTAFNAEFVRSTAALFAMVGHLTLYAAMVLLMGIHVALGVKHRSIGTILFGFGAVAVLAVLQYAARRIPGVIDRLDRAAPSRMPSPVFLDCCALLSFIGSLLGLVGWTVYAVATQDFGWIFPAVIAFILLQYLAVVTLNPESLHLTLTPDATAGEEAIGVLSFLVKLGVRAVPVVFGVGVMWGGFLLLYAVLMLVVPSIGEHAALDFGPDVLSQATLQGLALPPAQATAFVATVLVTLAAACPLAAYLGFLVCHLGIELLRSLLAIRSFTPAAKQEDGT
jgi:hypothetical protein